MDWGAVAFVSSIPGVLVSVGTIVQFVNNRSSTAGVAVTAPPHRDVAPYTAPAATIAAAPGVNWTGYFFSFKGRISRSRMWIFLGIYLLFVMLYGAMLAAGGGGDADKAPPAIQLIGAMFGLIYYYAGFAVAAKRLHDRNKSAHWLWLFAGLPLVLIVIAIGAGGSPSSVVTGIAGTALVVWAFVELYCLPGTVGANRYGPDPLGTR
jgi:uncharacterized membrane protein YhaH (DUF805 family)